MQLGRLGAWYSTDKLGGPQQIRSFVGTVERLGYDTLWYPESRGYESLSVAGFMLAQHDEAEARQLDRQHLRARRIHVAARHAVAARAVWRPLHPGPRGVSHVPMVEGIRGHTYEKPIPAMRAYLDGITKGEAGSDNWPIAIAALGPLMLKLSASQDARRASLQHHAAAHRRGGTYPRPGQVAGRPSRRLRWKPIRRRRARSAARNCRATWCWTTTATTGCASASPRRNWRTADPTGSSMRWCCGARPTRCSEGLRAHFAAGATHVCIQPVHEDGDTAARDRILTELANT